MTAGQELIDPRKVNEEAHCFGVKKSLTLQTFQKDNSKLRVRYLYQTCFYALTLAIRKIPTKGASGGLHTSLGRFRKFCTSSKKRRWVKE